MPVDPATVRRKVAWRVLPLMLLLYIIAYLDRVNAGFAKLQMAKALGEEEFTPEVFGWGFGIFFVGYLLLEIPGALLVEHWSARKWFARILVTWGACSMALATVTTPWHFYLWRFLLGLAEAGFFPGVVIYFTHWFPQRDRARALAFFILGVPISQAFGAAFSAWLMANNWFGVAGWQWVFLLEGAPAVLCGVVLPFVMTDRPRQARWLTPEERDWLEQTLDEERQQAASRGRLNLRQALREPTVLLLALAIMLTNTGGYGLTYWLPTVVNNLLTSMHGEAHESTVLAWTALVYLCGLPAVWLSGFSSDRTGDRKWHCFTGQVATGVFLLLAALPGQSWGQVFVWLCLVGFFAIFWPSPFWVLPTLTLSASAAAVSIGFINMCANVAGLIGNPLVGQMQKYGFGDRACLAALACCYLAGGAVVSLLRVRGDGGSVPRKRPTPSEEFRIVSKFHDDQPAPGSPDAITEKPASDKRNCPGCNASLPGKAVLCVQCGYDFRLGKARATIKSKEEAAHRVTPREWVLSFPGVLIGLTLHNARILLSLTSVVLLFGSSAIAATKIQAGAQGPPIWLVLGLLGGVGISLVSILLGFIGSVFCLGVPPRSSGRLPLALSLAFDVAAMPLGVVAAILDWTPLLSWLSGLCSWMLFLAFLVRLADYMDRPSESREAKGILLYGMILSIIPATLAALSFLTRDPTSVYIVAGFLLLPIGIWYIRLQITLYRLLETLRSSIRQQIDEAEREVEKGSY